MVKNKDGTYNIYAVMNNFYGPVFENLEKEEAFSALLTVAEHLDGVACFNGHRLIGFNE